MNSPRFLTNSIMKTKKRVRGNVIGKHQLGFVYKKNYPKIVPLNPLLKNRKKLA